MIRYFQPLQDPIVEAWQRHKIKPSGQYEIPMLWRGGAGMRNQVKHRPWLGGFGHSYIFNPSHVLESNLKRFVPYCDSEQTRATRWFSYAFLSKRASAF